MVGHGFNIRSLNLDKPSVSSGSSLSSDAKVNPFSISPEALAKLIRDRDLDQLQTYGGIEGIGGIGGIATGLLTDCDFGLDSSSENSLCPHDVRRSILGTNQLPAKKGKSFLGYAVAAVKDLTTAILLVVQFLSLVLCAFDLQPWRDMVPSTLVLAVVLSVGIYLAYRIDRRYTTFLSKQASFSFQHLNLGSSLTNSFHANRMKTARPGLFALDALLQYRFTRLW